MAFIGVTQTTLPLLLPVHLPVPPQVTLALQLTTSMEMPILLVVYLSPKIFLMLQHYIVLSHKWNPRSLLQNPQS